jgi:hypothetical protein
MVSVDKGIEKFVCVLNQIVLVVGGFVMKEPVVYGPVNIRVLFESARISSGR